MISSTSLIKNLKSGHFNHKTKIKQQQAVFIKPFILKFSGLKKTPNLQQYLAKLSLADHFDMSKTKQLVFQALKYGNILLTGLIIVFPRQFLKLVQLNCKRHNKHCLKNEKGYNSQSDTQRQDSDSSVGAKFKLACSLVRREQNISTKDSLELYGLFKQANVGACNIAKPSSIDYEAKLKWEHWERFKDLTKEEAKMLYTEYFLNLFPKYSEQFSKIQDTDEIENEAEDQELSEKDLFESSDEEKEEENNYEDECNNQEKREDNQKVSKPDAASRGFGLSVSKPKECIGENFLEKKETQDVSNQTIEFFSLLDEQNKVELEDSISKGFNLLTRNHQGSTSLHYCIENELTESFQTILESFPDVNAQDLDGYTPLHIAALNDNEEATKMLLQKGADPFLKDNEGHSAYETANSSIKKLIDSFNLS